MRYRFFVFYFFIGLVSAFSQTELVLEFKEDTMTLNGKGQVLEGKYIETTLKNFSVARLFKTDDNRYYLRFIITTNFYFDKVDVLEIKSGSKSYYAKDTKQYKVDKNAGLYIIEVFPNYIGTIKNYGITGLYFAQAETKFTKQDANQIKKMAAFFYEAITTKKN
jgi:hypothetical protein